MPVLNADKILKALHGAYCRDVGRKKLLELATTKIRDSGAPYTGAYIYMLHDKVLVLEAFAGRPTNHERIPVGSGLCGKAIENRADLNVPDVNDMPEFTGNWPKLYWPAK